MYALEQLVFYKRIAMKFRHRGDIYFRLHLLNYRLISVRQTSVASLRLAINHRVGHTAIIPFRQRQSQHAVL